MDRLNVNSHSILIMQKANAYVIVHVNIYEIIFYPLAQIFMHKSAMQMQHARDLQRAVGGGGAGSGGAGKAFDYELVVHNILVLCHIKYIFHKSIYPFRRCTASIGSGVGGGANNANNLPAILGTGNEVKPHQCQQCLKSFSSNHQLVQHIRVHTGEKPYKCSYCDRRFKQLSHVQQHTRLHTGKYHRPSSVSI